MKKLFVYMVSFLIVFMLSSHTTIDDATPISTKNPTWPVNFTWDLALCVNLGGTTAVCGVPALNGPCSYPQACPSYNH